MIFFLKLLLFCLLPALAQAADYTVSTGTKTVDGDTFCGGTCTSADTIIILGGARGNLLFQDFDGNGSYITIKNEDGVNKVEITNDNTVGTGVLSLSKCKYVDLRGNNDGDFTYGIHVRNCDPSRSGTVKVYGESDHIKLGYLEADCIGNTTVGGGGSGIQVQDSSLDNTWTFDTFEIHHNYIHDTRYAGMYLGHNWPWASPYDPYIANFSVHNNLLEDLGSYGITVKGVPSTSGVCSVYNNTVRRTGLIYASETGEVWQGIGVQHFLGSVYADVYDNWIEYTKGAGIKIGSKNHQVHDNIICGCGTGSTEAHGHGIVTQSSASDVHIYDNIIIQPKRYGIYALSATISALMSRNLIGDAVIGEWGEAEANDLTESTGDDANIYHADVVTFNFNTWLDDSDYSNDRFRTRSLLPANSGSGTALNTNLTWENFGDITGVDVFFEKDDTTPDVKVVDNGNVEIYNPPSDLDYDSTYYWQIVSYGGAETGGVYSFTTTSQANPPSLSGGDVKFNKNGASWKFNKNGVSMNF